MLLLWRAESAGQLYGWSEKQRHFIFEQLSDWQQSRYTILDAQYNFYTKNDLEEMWRSSSGTPHEHDDFYIDKDGIPHWDVSDPARYLKQYKARVTIEFET